MSYETMMYIGIGISVVMFVLSVILFVQLNIPRVIGGLSGYSARKEIENIREQNMQSGKKGYQTSPVNRARGKVTTPLGQRATSGRLSQKTADLARVINKTEMLATPAAQSAAQTSLLDASAQNPTTLLGHDAQNATTVLGVTAAATTAQDTTEHNVSAPQSAVFALEVDLAVTHTNETIQ